MARTSLSRSLTMLAMLLPGCLSLAAPGAADVRLFDHIALVPVEKTVQGWAIRKDKHGPTMLRHDGAGWREEPGIHPLAVAATTAGALWVWDGKAVRTPTEAGWIPVGVLPARRTTYRIRAMWGPSPSDLWLIESGPSPLHWNGRAWSRVDNGWSDEVRTLFSPEVAWGSGASDVWVAGSWQVESLDDQTHVDDHLLHWDGRSWRRVSGGVRAALPDERCEIHALWGSSGTDVWAAGSATGRHGRRGLVLHHDGTRWQPVETQTAVPISGIHGTRPDDVWFFGSAAGGTMPVLLEWNGVMKRWAIETPIAALRRDGAGVLWKAGYDGGISRLAPQLTGSPATGD